VGAVMELGTLHRAVHIERLARIYAMPIVTSLWKFHGNAVSSVPPASCSLRHHVGRCELRDFAARVPKNRQRVVIAGNKRIQDDGS